MYSLRIDDFWIFHNCHYFWQLLVYKSRIIWMMVLKYEIKTCCIRLLFVYLQSLNDETIMDTITLENTDWLMRILSTQSNEVKLDIINRLSASMMRNNKRKKPIDMSFFDGLTNAWDDGISPDEEIQKIRNARTSGVW